MWIWFRNYTKKNLYKISQNFTTHYVSGMYHLSYHIIKLSQTKMYFKIIFMSTEFKFKCYLMCGNKDNFVINFSKLISHYRLNAVLHWFQINIHIKSVKKTEVFVVLIIDSTRSMHIGIRRQFIFCRIRVVRKSHCCIS